MVLFMRIHSNTRRLFGIQKIQFVLAVMLAFFLLGATVCLGASDSGEGTGHQETPNLPLILMALCIILAAAKIGGHVFEKFKQPAVLGELVFGVCLGNLWVFNFHGLDFLKSNDVLQLLAEIGIVFMLFEVGLESNLSQMLEVGGSSFLVALLGVIAPMLLGWGVGMMFLPTASPLVHLFLGATLSATSVGITARVLKDLKRTTTAEARIILGAAVIDDVMGLVILAAVSGIIQAASRGQGGISLWAISWIILKSVLFLVLAIWLGSHLSPKVFQLASKLNGQGLLLVTGVLFCFVLAFLAGKLGLAPIVGAFAAGLILEPVHYEDLSRRENQTLLELVGPISTFLVPVFFVLMGVRVDLRTFADLRVLGFAGVLTLAAILGKQVCAFGVLEKGLDRLAVGLGMIPRGEVGLIFAGLGTTLLLKGSPVINPSSYAAIVIMVISTTLVTPPLLKARLQGFRAR